MHNDPVRKSDEFRDHVLDQLRGLPEVDARAMFGGHGLYAGPAFFGIVYKGRLYLKTSDATRGRYVDARMKPFRPSARQTLKTYYEVPADVIERAASLAKWAREAVAAAR